MESEFLKMLGQYGILGLWTAWLLWANHQQKKEQNEEKKRGAEVLAYHQEKIVSKLSSQEKMLQAALEKIDTGLREMRNKYQEERIARQYSKADDLAGVLKRTIREMKE